MPTGVQHVIKFHENESGTPVLDSFTRKEFNHDSSFVAMTWTAVKEDFTGSPHDAFTVQWSYPSGQEIATSTTVAQLLTRARDYANTALGNGEAGAAT